MCVHSWCCNRQSIVLVESDISDDIHIDNTYSTIAVHCRARR